MADWKADLARVVRDKQQADKAAAAQRAAAHDEATAAIRRAVVPAMEDFVQELRKIGKECEFSSCSESAHITVQGKGTELDLTIEAKGFGLQQTTRGHGYRGEKGFQPRRADDSTPTMAELTKEDVLAELVHIYQMEML